MMKTNKENHILDQLTLRSRRAMPVTEDLGQMVYDENLALGGSDNGPHQLPETREVLTPSNTKTRKKLSKSQNREVMICYYKSEPEKLGYRKRFHSIWHEQNPDLEITEQHLSDQQRTIIKNKWFSDTELGELKRMSKGNISESQNTTESENEVILETQQQNQEAVENEAPVITNQLIAGEKDLIEKITNNITDIPERVQIPSMISENKKLLKENTDNINRLLPYIPTADSTQTNNLIYAAAKTIAEMMGKKFEKKVKRKKKKEAPPWKIRLTNKVNQLRKNLSILTEMKNQKIKNIRIMEEMTKKYNLEKNPIKSCTEDLKQEITSISHKIQ